MRVLVTGATGSLGLPACLELKKRGYDVVAQGRNRSRLETLERHGIRTIQTELTDGDLRPFVEGCEGVVHSAALTRPWGAYRDFVAPNIAATESLVRAAIEAGVRRFIHISTTAVYYNGTSRTDLTEESEIPSRQPIAYAATKRESEVRALGLAKEAKLPILILRPRAILSAYDQTLLPRILPKMRRGYFPLIDGGRGKVDVTPVESIVDAIAKGLEAPAALSGEIYNLTNDEPITVGELLKTVSQAFDLHIRFVPVSSSIARPLSRSIERAWLFLPRKEPPITSYQLDLISRDQTFDIKKIKRDLGYRPAIPVREAISRIGKSWQ